LSIGEASENPDDGEALFTNKAERQGTIHRFAAAGVESRPQFNRLGEHPTVRHPRFTYLRLREPPPSQAQRDFAFERAEMAGLTRHKEINLH
jgi:hypothetical protein